MTTREELVQFNWMYNYFSYNGLKLKTGEKIHIIDPGTINHDSGPDFFNAKIKVDNTIWAGNVEIHINSSDWYNHGHHSDTSYDNVILHVVINDNTPTINSKGVEIYTLVISFPDALEWNLLRLLGSGKSIPCAENIRQIDPIIKKNWVNRLSVERLELKNQFVKESVTLSDNNWEEAFYRSLARSFGLAINALPFEMLAKATPLKVISKQSDNLNQVEAILFGQAGLLKPKASSNSYFLMLNREYNYLKKKYNLKPIENHLWKFMRTRPTAFPTIRISQFADLVHSSTSLFSRMIESPDVKQIFKLLDLKASGFWDTHYTFKNESPQRVKHLGKKTAETIIVNTIVPFLFAYGNYRKDNNLKYSAISLLENISPETNFITREFIKLGFMALSASDTQALIHLKNYYCKQKKCIYCHLGATLLLKKSNT